jgi:nucleoside permease NupC
VGVSSHHTESSVLDYTKIPSGLVVNRVWVPVNEPVHRRPIAYATEPRRRIAAAVMIALGVILGLAVAVARGPFWLAFVSLLIAWAGVAYAGGGRTGFYEVDDDGGLGEYLGRSRPDVGSMRPGKPRE